MLFEHAGWAPGLARELWLGVAWLALTSRVPGLELLEHVSWLVGLSQRVHGIRTLDLPVKAVAWIGLGNIHELGAGTARHGS